MCQWKLQNMLVAAEEVPSQNWLLSWSRFLREIEVKIRIARRKRGPLPNIRRVCFQKLPNVAELQAIGKGAEDQGKQENCKLKDKYF